MIFRLPLPNNFTFSTLRHRLKVLVSSNYLRLVINKEDLSGEILEGQFQFGKRDQIDKLNPEARELDERKDKSPRAFQNNRGLWERTLKDVLNAKKAELDAIENPMSIKVENNILTISRENIKYLRGTTEFQVFFYYLVLHLEKFFQEIFKEKFKAEDLEVIIM